MANLTNQINFDRMHELNEKNGDALRRKMDEWAKVNRPDPLVIKMQAYREEQRIKALIAPEYRDTPGALQYAMTWHKEGVPFIDINDRLEVMEEDFNRPPTDDEPTGPIEYIDPPRKEKSESFYGGLL